MSELHDRELQAFFDATPELHDDAAFVSETMARTDKRRFRLLGARVSVLAVIIALEILLESPIQQSMGALGALLTQPVITIDGEWAGFLLEPINSVAGLLGVILLSLHWIMRKVVR
ncbi:MAG: hypothetical protein AAGL69_15205 [Pseudomonadota bacterium]